MPPDPPDFARRKLCAGAQIVRSAQIVRRARIVLCAETEPPSTMMLSHFSRGNRIFRHLKLELLTQFPAPNDEKYLYFLKNIHVLNWVIRLTDHPPQTTLSIFIDILFGLNYA